MNAKLLVIQGQPQGKCLSFPLGEYLFGRAKECHIRPNTDWASRHHCRLQVTALGQMTVEDLGSRNGTLVNGQRITAETPLNIGDRLSIGPIVFEAVRRDDGPRFIPPGRG